MLLVDRILELEDDSIICEKTFRDNEYFFDGHFPDHPIVPGVILCECAAQAGAVLLFSTLANRNDSTPDVNDNSTVAGIPMLTRMSDIKFKQQVRPNDTISVQCGLVERVSTAYMMKAQVRRQSKLVASLEFVCVVQPVSKS